MENKRGVLVAVIVIAFFAMYPPSIGQSAHTRVQEEIKPTLYQAYMTNLELTKLVENSIKQLETNLTKIKQKK